MRYRTKMLACFMLIVIVGVATAANEKETDAAILGVWRGELDSLPAVTLNITEEAGPLQGAILFYLIRRDEGKPPTSSPGIPEPLFNPYFDGKSLTFQLSHRRAHANTSSDPPTTFRLDLTGPDEAKLVRIPQDGPPYVRMVREKHKTSASWPSPRTFVLAFICPVWPVN
jgi:hypothetical protein